MSAAKWMVLAAAVAACGPNPRTGPAVTTPPIPTGGATTKAVAVGDATTADGTRVTVGCRQMYVRCTGPASDAPTVILDADWNESSAAWATVQNELSRDVRVCSYDRAGVGYSDPDDVGPRTAQLMVYDLAELLAAAKETGPFVVVGDGYAVPTARLFAAQHAGSVDAIVLLGPDRRHRAGAGEAFDIDRSDAQASAAPLAKSVQVVVVPDDPEAGSALKEKPAEVVKTIRRLVRAGPGGESAAR